MNELENSAAERSRSSVATDVVLFILLTLGLLYVDTHYVPAGLYQGFLTVIGSFVIVMALTRLRSETLADIGLRRPKRYWTLPLWIIMRFCSGCFISIRVRWA